MFYQVIVTKDCNFGCLYCMQNPEKHLDCPELDIDKVCAFIFNNEMLENNAAKIIALNISGGEPLLRFKTLKEIVQKIEDFSVFHGWEAPYFELSTNLSLLTDEHIAFFCKHNIEIFIGFDGIERSFNANRTVKNTHEKMYKTVLNNVTKLYNHSDMKKESVALNIVITPNNIKYLYKNVRFLYERFNEMQLSINLAYNLDWNKKALFLFNKLLRKTAQYYIKIITRSNFEYKIKFFDIQIGRNISEPVYSSAKCGAAEGICAIKPDGTLVACGNFIGSGIDLKEVKTGDIENGLNHNLIQQFKDKLNFIDKTGCTNCQFMNRCYIHCPYVNYHATQNMLKISEQECELNKIQIIIADKIIDTLSKKNNSLFEKRYIL